MWYLVSKLKLIWSAALSVFHKDCPENLDYTLRDTEIRQDSHLGRCWDLASILSSAEHLPSVIRDQYLIEIPLTWVNPDLVTALRLTLPGVTPLQPAPLPVISSECKRMQISNDPTSHHYVPRTGFKIQYFPDSFTIQHFLETFYKVVS